MHAFLPTPFVDAPDRALMKRISIVMLIVVGLFGGFVRLHLFYSKKFRDQTAPAKWIWRTTQLSRGHALAFFATRDFDLPPNRQYAKIKIAGDPHYTLYFNGTEIAGRAAGNRPTIDVYDVSRLARDGRNRIVVGVRSTNGVGGLLVAVDVSRELENYVVTDASWRIAAEWSPRLLLSDLPQMEEPMILGEPPIGRWNDLEARPGVFFTSSGTTLRPRESFDFMGRLPEVKVIAGVAVASSKRVRATAFDFGFVDGHARLTMKYQPPFSRLVNVRFANARDELFPSEGNVHPFVFARGEMTIVDPEMRHFRYIVVYGGEATAEVIR